MADLLGIQEQQLASAIQKQKIIEKAGENGIKINISDNGSIAAAAQQLANDNKLTQEELKQFNDSNDKRTTEDLLEQQLQNSNEQLVLQKLNFARTSTQAMRDDFTAAVEEMKRIQQNQSAEDMKSLGATLLAGNIAGTVFNALKNRAGSGFAVKAPTYSAGGTTGGPQDDLIATPTGYGDRILLAGEDTFALNNDDTVVAGTNLFPKSNSGNSNLASKIDEMIAEIRNQTRILSKRDNTFGAGINSAYYG
jgi:hypothetical protein